MEFEFLPKLPKANLDDRTFKDLVEECILRIPRYCPEWTNYNPSDPGITLIELFAWLTDQMLLRFNQVPRRNYIAFLELLGVRLMAPTPAQTDITFYLTTSLDETYTIPSGVQLATLRTETEEAIVFSSDRPLVIGKPTIRQFLTAETTEEMPLMLRDRLANIWTQSPSGEWTGREQPVFNDQPEPGNCFYIVFDGAEPIEGNVIALTVKGEAATPTGINPNNPPRLWQAWNGMEWVSVMLDNGDDKTQGFSFNDMALAGSNPLQGADVVLHLPQAWPVTRFITYQGRWLRCCYTPLQRNQPAYTSSPRIVGLSARSIGGTVIASQSELIRNEILGESDGNPGQKFQLLGFPVLKRREDEYILVTPPGAVPQRWQEVNDFSESTSQDLHYTIDSRTGEVQFGPLIREPGHLQEATMLRSMVRQGYGEGNAPALRPGAGASECQYGAVPSRGAEIRMVAYRKGGGAKGNVQRGTVSNMKSAVPYVARVVNHVAARNGADAESLEQAAIRVPAILRTRDRAVTMEDFEVLARQAGGGAVARSRCLPADEDVGVVKLLLVPQANTEAIERGIGIDPDLLSLTPELTEQVRAFLDERRLIGTRIKLQDPEYVGVAVQTEVGLEPEYNHPRSQQEILFSLRVALYRFLNPLTGGPEGKGWPFGRAVYASDVVNLFQQVPGVRFLGIVQLFEFRKRGGGWRRSLSPDGKVDPGAEGLICSWLNNGLRSGHIINLIE